MKVKELLGNCSKSFHTTSENDTVAQALKLMSGYNVSALVVTDGNIPKGIFTERDLVRCHIIFPDENIKNIPVKDVMTSKLIVADPEDTAEDAMGMMIKAKIRHLPLLSDGKINAVICLEDLVREHVGVLTKELHYLRDYISDLQDAAHD